MILRSSAVAREPLNRETVSLPKSGWSTVPSHLRTRSWWSRRRSPRRRRCGCRCGSRRGSWEYSSSWQLPRHNSAVRKVEVVKADTLSLEDDDDDLTCRICMSSFWYKSQIVEHLSKTHSVKDPEAFIKEK